MEVEANILNLNKQIYNHLNILIKENKVDRVHALKVAENILILFDSLQEVHNMRHNYRNILWISALMHDIGVNTDSENHHKVGRDILIQNPSKEMDNESWLMVAWIVYLHKKKITPQRIEKFGIKTASIFSHQLILNTLRLAALLRIADGLDYSRMCSTIDNIVIDKKEITLYLKGLEAQLDIKRAEIKSDLWNFTYDHHIKFEIKN